MDMTSINEIASSIQLIPRSVHTGRDPGAGHWNSQNYLTTQFLESMGFGSSALIHHSSSDLYRGIDLFRRGTHHLPSRNLSFVFFFLSDPIQQNNVDSEFCESKPALYTPD